MKALWDHVAGHPMHTGYARDLDGSKIAAYCFKAE
jgi:hypothetical protein